MANLHGGYSACCRRVTVAAKRRSEAAFRCEAHAVRLEDAPEFDLANEFSLVPCALGSSRASCTADGPRSGLPWVVPRIRGTAIIGVRSTGELEGRQARAAYEIYERLSQAGATLLPPAVGFVFDRERRSDAKLAAVENTGHGRVKFLPRRMYENYLLMADAIAAVGNTTEGFRDEPLTADEVERWIDKLRTEEAFGGSAQKTNSACWRIDIDGARLLERLFTDLSEARVSFSKTTHSVELTRWIIANAPGELAELAQFLKEILSRPVIGDEPQGAPVAQPAICSHEW